MIKCAENGDRSLPRPFKLRVFHEYLRGLDLTKVMVLNMKLRVRLARTDNGFSYPKEHCSMAHLLFILRTV